MSLVESLGRVQQIQTTLSQFDPTLTARSASYAGMRGATSATRADQPSFADALAGVLGPTGTSGPPAAAGRSGVTGEQVAAAAQRYVGVPYVWGGTDPRTGMDCSGFVQRVYADLGVDLPRVVRDQMTHGTPVASLAEARPGDLLVSHGGDHISIYLGNGKAIDAPKPGQTIQVRDAWEKHSNLTAIRRIVPAGPPVLTGVEASGVVAGSGPVLGPVTATLDATQRRYAQVIVDEVRARGLPAQAAVNALSTALQESSLRMYWNPKVPGSRELAPDPAAMGTDGYSVGLFQQQVNGTKFSWGTVAEAMDARASTRMFLDRLTAIPGWQTMQVAAADQAVQRSAHPNAYAKWESTARQLVAEMYGAGAP